MNISRHFTLKELTYSDYAVRNAIDNTPDGEVTGELIKLANNILEPVRAILGVPLRITSGYRSFKVNKGIGGSLTSQHMKGQAADFEPVGMTIEEAFKIIKESKSVLFDQLILEFPPNGWVHISRSDNPRRQTLLAVAGKFGTEYSNA